MSARGTPTRGRGGVLDTGISLLEAIAKHAGPLTVTELARAVGVDKANAHRVAQQLVTRGYLVQDSVTKRYDLTVKVVTLAGSVLTRLDVNAVATPTLSWLQAETGEGVHLALRTPTGGVYIAQQRAAGRVVVETQIGGRPPIHSTATGKALFCEASSEELDRVLPGSLERFTDRTIVDRQELIEHLGTVAARGYACDDEEFHPDVRCVAAPIRDVSGQIVACVGLSGPASRIASEALAKYGEITRAAAERVTRCLGGCPTNHRVATDQATNQEEIRS